jgi:hypothetical protein
MRILIEREHRGVLLRLMSRRSGEVAYAVLGIRGLQAEIEFPSDWHEERRGWVRLGFGLFRVAASFPWKWVVPDDYQCSGPTFGFTFFDDRLHLHWGKTHGKRDDPMAVVLMPWAWRHRLHELLTEPETHPYTYTLRSGEVQHRTATIKVERRTWTRWWLPFKRVSRSIDVEFSGEVGERSGSWKGGCTGCGFPMLASETPVQALRRMEATRKF